MSKRCDNVTRVFHTKQERVMFVFFFFENRKQENALKLQEEKKQKALEDAEKSHKKHDKYLQETVNKYVR